MAGVIWSPPSEAYNSEAMIGDHVLHGHPLAVLDVVEFKPTLDGDSSITCNGWLWAGGNVLMY